MLHIVKLRASSRATFFTLDSQSRACECVVLPHTNKIYLIYTKHLLAVQQVSRSQSEKDFLEQAVK